MYVLRYRTAALYMDTKGQPTWYKELAREFFTLKEALAWRAGRFRDPLDANCWMAVTTTKGQFHV